MWSIEMIKALCIECCRKCEVEFTAEVRINGRLKAVLGRCIYEKMDEYCFPICLEFSKQFLETSTDQSVIDVIKHECAHYIVTKITHTNHGHDAVFKSYCAQIGTLNDTATFVPALTSETDKTTLHKYSIYCSGCGGYIDHRDRACKITKQLHLYYSHCCGKPLRVTQNW